MKTWAARVDGEILFQITGPNAEQLARAAAEQYGGVLVYREPEKPTEQNGWQLHGPWTEAE
ncbi:hypothetical protein [Actinomadura litoris]|uniref:Uncharacterized protein n=1 Tax=Actinomadura litoris TaxID=2678616 RepID=A0A7K1LAJ4_9ACTN|nr:hypothetical protein [Actinomadura litoris]MUN41434.1 hypothetical protein [Actinomadura litoris]